MKYFKVLLFASLAILFTACSSSGGSSSSSGDTPVVQESKLLSAGDRHTVEIKADGTLWAYGYNNHGQLGLGDTAHRNAPVQVGGDSDWVSVSIGGDSSEYMPHNDYDVSGYTVAIKSDGTLWAWGDNAYGQLGDGTTDNHTTPIQIGADSDWVSVSAGDQHGVAIKSNGTLWAWGRNNHGQIGNGTTGTNVLYPVQITAAGNGWVSVSAGGGDDTSLYSHSSGHTVAIKSDGTLWAWGHNAYGQLGNGTDINSNIPVQENTRGANWASVSAGDSHTFAIRSDGTLWSWGWNVYGQLGNGTKDTNVHSIPVQIETSYLWVSVSAGGFHNLAIRNDNTLWTSGRNNYGQLGNSTVLSETGLHFYFTQVGTDTWSSASAGGYHTIAIKTGSTELWTWGDNKYGQLGNGMITEKHVPIKESDDQNWSSMSGGGHHTVAIKTNGELWSWGKNEYGQLATGDADFITTIHVQESVKGNWSSVTTGFTHTAAIKSNGTLWVWGGNQYGQIGDGTTSTATVDPVQESTAGVNWVSVASGGWHNVAINVSGELWAWGRNNYGQLGDNTVDNSSIPTYVVAEGDNWESASASDYSTVAIKTDGTLWAWGWNVYGQLGNGTTDYSNQSVPVQVGADTNWASVSVSDYHTVAIKDNGTLWAWGRNDHGQIGNNTVGVNVLTPVQITSAGNNWASVSTGDHHTVAIKDDGTLWAWGWNNHGQLGDDTTAEKHTPVQIGSATNWISVSGGDYFSVAISSDNKLWAWGDNDYGQVHEWVTEPQLQP